MLIPSYKRLTHAISRFMRLHTKFFDDLLCNPSKISTYKNLSFQCVAVQKGCLNI